MIAGGPDGASSGSRSAERRSERIIHPLRPLRPDDAPSEPPARGIKGPPGSLHAQGPPRQPGSGPQGDEGHETAEGLIGGMAY